MILFYNMMLNFVLFPPFIYFVKSGKLSGHLLGKSCSLGLRYEPGRVENYNLSLRPGPTETGHLLRS